jgi:primosomal protein N' (replication factor Y)
LFAALARHEFAAFAAQQLKEREQAGMPPFGSQALVRAEARTQEAAQSFLRSAAEAVQGDASQVTLYSPVPMGIQRVANIERAQMLVESGSRRSLQNFLAGWRPTLHQLRAKDVIRWAIDVDPLAI